jgi:hypothetical protein
MDHVLYKDGDAVIPDGITDRNGLVALDMCKNCGQAESDLTDQCPEWLCPICDGGPANHCGCSCPKDYS